MRELVVVVVVAMLLRPLPAVGVAPAAHFRYPPPPARGHAVGPERGHLNCGRGGCRARLGGLRQLRLVEARGAEEVGLHGRLDHEELAAEVVCAQVPRAVRHDVPPRGRIVARDPPPAVVVARDGEAQAHVVLAEGQARLRRTRHVLVRAPLPPRRVRGALGRARRDPFVSSGAIGSGGRCRR